MKNFKLAAVLLPVLIIVIFSVSCGSEIENAGTETETDDNTGINNSESEDLNSGGSVEDTADVLGFVVSGLREEIPDSDFGGRDFVILVGDPDEQVWTYTNMVVEEETGDSINDSYYRRNRLVEDRLNINIKQTVTALGNDQTRIRRAVDSGDNSFDIAFIRYGGAANLAINNYLAPLNDVPWLDFDKPWWDRGSFKDLSIAGRSYMMASDLSIGDNDNTWLIYFDKQYVQDYGLDTPYELVSEGRWTFDVMLEMMKTVAHDVDGDGRMTANDRFGFLTHGENYAGMWIAAAQTLIAKNENDMPYISFGSETFINIWQKIVEIMNDESCRADNIEFISTGLRDGQTLFGTEILKFVRDYRENEREFGIIPMPKFNETQENYHTYVAVSAPLFVIPGNNFDIDTTGIIAEAMAAEGHRTIMPAYYDVTIAGKLVRDVESIDMLDIAFSTRMYDLGVVFNWGNMREQLTTMGSRGDTNIASMIERRGDIMQTALNRALEAFEAH